MFKAVVGTIATEKQVESVMDELVAAGFPASDISVLCPRTKGSLWADIDTSVPAAVAIGAATVGSAGMWVGSGLGLLAGLGALVIPGVGGLLAVGPLLGMLSGAAVGATVGATLGTVTGVLVALGLPEQQAKQYEVKVAAGRILVSVHTEDRRGQWTAAGILRRLGAEDLSAVEELGEPSRAPSAPQQIAP